MGYGDLGQQRMGILTPLRHGRLHFGASLAEMAHHGLYGELARRAGVLLPPLSRISPAAALPARINSGRWIVDCPDCGGAEFVFLDEPLMFCMNCFNAGAAAGQWRSVQLPAPTLRDSVEAALVVRPRPDSRNWEPGESVEALQEENIQHGLARRASAAEIARMRAVERALRDGTGGGEID